MRALVLACLAVAGCSTGTQTKRPQRPPELQAKFDEAIKNKEIRLGMVEGEVQRAWGRPQRKSKITRHGRDQTMWAYAFTEVYFDKDGYVVGWHAAGG